MGGGVRVAVAAALLLIMAGLMAAPAWAQSEESTVEETDVSMVESQAEGDAGRAEKSEKESNKDDVEVDVGDDGVSVQTRNVSVEAGSQTDEQQAEDDTVADESDLASLTAAQVQNFSCVQVLQYVREVVDISVGGRQYAAFSALERRAIECQRTDVIGGTVPGGKLPITGGFPLMGGGVVLGLALLGTGISIVRAGARRR